MCNVKKNTKEHESSFEKGAGPANIVFLLISFYILQPIYNKNLYLMLSDMASKK